MVDRFTHWRISVRKDEDPDDPGRPWTVESVVSPGGKRSGLHSWATWEEAQADAVTVATRMVRAGLGR